jgi:hypothetical protein
MAIVPSTVCSLSVPAVAIANAASGITQVSARPPHHVKAIFRASLTRDFLTYGLKRSIVSGPNCHRKCHGWRASRGGRLRLMVHSDTAHDHAFITACRLWVGV